MTPKPKRTYLEENIWSLAAEGADALIEEFPQLDELFGFDEVMECVKDAVQCFFPSDTRGLARRVGFAHELQAAFMARFNVRPELEEMDWERAAEVVVVPV